MGFGSVGMLRLPPLDGPRSLAVTPAQTWREATVDSPDRRKLRRAAQEFESILIAAWWKSASRSFSGLADEEEGGMQAFRDFGLEAMSLAIAQAGGLGIGRMMLEHLEKGCVIRSELFPGHLKPLLFRLLDLVKRGTEPTTPLLGKEGARGRLPRPSKKALIRLKSPPPWPIGAMGKRGGKR